MAQTKLRIGCVLVSVGASLGGCIDAVEVADSDESGSGGQAAGGQPLQWGGGGWVGTMPVGGGGGFIGDVVEGGNGGVVGVPLEVGGSGTGGWVVGSGGCATCSTGGAVGTMPVGGQVELGGEGGEAP